MRWAVLILAIIMMANFTPEQLARALMIEKVAAQERAAQPPHAWEVPGKYPTTPADLEMGRRSAEQLARDMEAWNQAGRVGKKPVPRPPGD